MMRPGLRHAAVLALMTVGVAAGAAAQQIGAGTVPAGTRPAMETLRRPASHLLQQVRAAWVMAVDEAAWIDIGVARLDELTARGASPALVGAYRGAFAMLRSKHAWAPRAKWRYAQEGLAALDRAVALEQADPEIRYLRLMSCYYLPFFFGRGDSVAADLDALARLLPEAEGAYPEAWYEGVVQFVLEHGELDLERARTLRETLGSTGDAAESGAPGRGS